MSDADTDANDGFDKEAEREKLREKYERDREKRESTQKMSELLLQGATMTNKHCDTCGNPLFRHEGRAFCPSCGEGSGTETGPRDESAATEGENAGAEAGSQPAAGAAEPAGAGATPEPEPEPNAAGPESGAERTGVRAPEPRSDPGLGTETGTERTTDAADAPAGGGDLAAARQSVRATLTDLAARAERSNDAAHTKELLAATREAAETLRELNRLE
jgi:uncharacterized Zn finger protein (UPF0148 family)